MAGGVRANWFMDSLDEVAQESEDAARRAIEEVGLPIQLDGEPKLQARLIELTAQEEFLFNQGVECSVKDAVGTSCLACPIRRDEETQLGALCTIGCEQERVTTEIAVLHAASG